MKIDNFQLFHVCTLSFFFRLSHMCLFDEILNLLGENEFEPNKLPKLSKKQF